MGEFSFTPQQTAEIASLVAQIRAVETVIGRGAARKSVTKTLHRLPLSLDQKREVLSLLGYCDVSPMPAVQGESAPSLPQEVA